MVSTPIRGYAEGYYGRLLSWSERGQLLECLAQLGFNSYLYAPKEDVCHRWQWRKSYSSSWRKSFSEFCQKAAEYNIDVVAGVAPGIDFNFAHLNNGADFRSLADKCRQLKRDGAYAISLLMDDIDTDFKQRSAGFLSEGVAHATLANELASTLASDSPDTAKRIRSQTENTLWVTPRIYADELAGEDPDYLPAFLTTLDQQHLILYSGSDIVSRTLSKEFDQLLRIHSEHRTVAWDNLYANDYCPRRLFVGPWQGRCGIKNVLLNPTGMVHTDCLLLDMMASCDASSCTDDIVPAVLLRHGVPVSFLSLLNYFYHPVFNEAADVPKGAPNPEALDALEDCLWHWKSPLSREWYPYLFGLKHDLLIQAGKLPDLRIQKTQTSPLAHTLLNT
ncbi:MAG: beta-N-acetylglucosaminidase domain-containing protein [Granulosicoccus sp.]|nr:beta-N-acetylglucosaminidase domain-containing protein [Granulosicoccus sp.]